MNKYTYLLRRGFLTFAACSCLVVAFAGIPPLFPTDIVLGAQNEIAISEKGTQRVSFFSSDGEKLLRSIPTRGTPTGLLLDSQRMYVTTSDLTGYLQLYSIDTGEAEASIHTGSGARAPIWRPDKKRIYVCNQFQNTVSEIDPVAKRVTRTVSLPREPRALIFSKDGKYMFVANFLPAQRADADHVSASVSVVRTDDLRKIKDIPLANGSNALQAICITPDGKYIYVSHNLGRFTVPTSQLQQGWMNTSAFSIIDVESQQFLGTVVVDEPERGAAGIWDIACDEQSIFITHSGTHEVSVIDHRAMLRKFLDHPSRRTLEYDLTFLYGLRKRIPIEGNGPRKMILGEGRLYIPTYFADVLNILDIRSHTVVAARLNPQREESAQQKGERYFNDASNCFQNWQSCSGCHPGEARTDGMNWDLMNDGVGNPKNCKSLLLSHVTAPNMISGIRHSAEIAVRAGFKYIQFFDIEEEEAKCVDAYLKSLQPVASPYLVDGTLSKQAEAGRKVFEKFHCDECHSGPYYTDLKMHRIGQDIEFEKGWDTPTLRESWRTAPYLFDGRAATMEEVFSVHKHGIDRKISKEEIKVLTEYVNSL